MRFDPKRSIYMNEDINPQSVVNLIAEISKLVSADPKEEVNLFITSTGGNVSDAFAAYDYITKLAGVNLRTIVLGEASSTAIMLFLAGQKEKRLIGHLASMKFHRFSFTFDKGAVITARQASKIYKNLKISEDKYIETILRRVPKMTKIEVEELLDQEEIMTAETALELGFAYEII